LGIVKGLEAKGITLRSSDTQEHVADAPATFRLSSR